MNKKEKKVVIIGLDCATPQLVFDRFKDQLPNLQNLIKRSTYGKLRSTIPPITVPAWISMFTGKDPGELGIYGFRNRRNYNYLKLEFANSTWLNSEPVWETISKYGKRSILLSIPMSYPPQPINGIMITDFLTPDINSDFTYPASVKQEILEKVGNYIIDVEGFRTEEKDRLLKQIYEMTENHFKIANYLITHKPYDLFIMVEMGPDRLHHGFWRFCDPEHPKYEKGNPYENVMLEYYKFLDTKIGEFLQNIDPSASILIVSDHGAKKMIGGICINAVSYTHLTLPTKA